MLIKGSSRQDCEGHLKQTFLAYISATINDRDFIQPATDSYFKGLSNGTPTVDATLTWDSHVKK